MVKNIKIIKTLYQLVQNSVLFPPLFKTHPNFLELQTSISLTITKPSSDTFYNNRSKSSTIKFCKNRFSFGSKSLVSFINGFHWIKRSFPILSFHQKVKRYELVFKPKCCLRNKRRVLGIFTLKKKLQFPYCAATARQILPN